MSWLVEAALWTFFVLCDGVNCWKVPLLGLIAVEARHQQQRQRQSSSGRLWRTRSSVSSSSSSSSTQQQQQHPHRGGDEQGHFMAAVLVPVLQARLQICGNTANSNQEEKSEVLLLCWAACSLLAWLQWLSRTTRILSAAVVGWLLLLMPIITEDALRFRLVVAMWLLLYHAIIFLPPSHRRVFSEGEWTVVSTLAAIAVVEWMLWDGPVTHQTYIALTGGTACLLSCILASYPSAFLVKAGLAVLGPLLAIDSILWRRHAQSAAADAALVPPSFSLSWLTKFLSEQEGTSSSHQYPRWVWLVYWAAILLLALALAPQTSSSSSSSSSSVVVARKWFHLVALVLFVPVTLTASHMMSLCYAVSFCVLFVLECLRPDLPNTAALQEYFQEYLDPGKDSEEGMVVSHMALLVGCAAPLWMYEYLNQEEGGDYQLLSLWGVLVLGVGDSMGALVGTFFGRRMWPGGGSRRTIEGSIAMWITLALACVPFADDSMPWLPAVTFVTLLEAYTMQIDNLVLPLAGAAVLLATGGST